MKCGCVCLLPVVVLGLASCGGPPEQTAAPEQTPAAPAPAAEAEAPKPAGSSEITARGVFTGRSGKPMARARLMLGEISGDDVFRFARIRLVAKVPTAVADAEGKFEFKGFTPGLHTLVYQPVGSAGIVPVEIPIRTLSGTTDSIAPLLRASNWAARRLLASAPGGRTSRCSRAIRFIRKDRRCASGTRRRATVREMPTSRCGAESPGWRAWMRRARSASRPGAFDPLRSEA